MAINLILQHVLPPYFQKCRYYGLHAPATFKAVKNKIPLAIKRENKSIRSIFQIIKTMLGINDYSCHQCGGNVFIATDIKPDKYFIYSFLNISTNNKSPPQYIAYHHNSSMHPNNANNNPISEIQHFDINSTNNSYNCKKLIK